MVERKLPNLATNRQLVIGGDFNIDLGRREEASVRKVINMLKGHSLLDGGG